jgi:hypothetical protein
MSESKWKDDHPELARQFAARDRARALNNLAQLYGNRLQPHQGYGLAGTDVASIVPNAIVRLEIGARGDLTAARAQAAATTFKQVMERVSPGCIYIHLVGYDDDLREIPEIAEAAAYVRLWARLAGLAIYSDLTACAPDTRAFLAACGCFGEEAKQRVILPPRAREQ